MEPRARGSLTERVTERLRRAILDGELQLGDVLSEEKLATKLGVSRSPVRHAFAELEQQGLIDIRPQRGSFVFQPSREDTANLCEFRRMIEIEALDLAFARNRARAIAGMRAAAEDMACAAGSGDHRRDARADDAFHDAIIENSANPYLISAYKLISGKLAALRSHHSTLPTRRQANIEHFEIIAHLDAGELTEARAALTTHILKMADRYSLDYDLGRMQGGRASRNPSLDQIGPLAD